MSNTFSIMMVVKNHASKWPKYSVFILMIALFIALVLTNFVVKYPLKSSEDIWHYLAAIHELENNYQDVNDPFFPSGPKDIHYGPYFVLAGITSRTLSIEPVTLYLGLSVFMVFYLLICFSRLYRSLYPKETYEKSYFFALFSLICWGASNLSFSGYFSLPDLILNGAAPANFALGTAVLAISFLVAKTRNQNKKYLVVFLLSLLTFITHPLTGMMLFLVLGAYVVSLLIKHKKITKEIVVLSGFPIAIFLLALAWPYYSIYDFIFHKASLVNIEGEEIPFKVAQWIPVGGLGILGALYVIKQKSAFTIIWVGGFALVLLSYLTPFHISLYWRFLPLLLLPCFAALFYEITSKIKKESFSLILILVFVVFGIGSSYSKYNYRASWKSYDLNEWSYLKTLNGNDVLLSDPYSEYIAAGLYGINIVATRTGHQNPLNVNESVKREDDLNKVISNNITAAEMKTFLDKYNVSYVLVNNDVRFYYDWNSKEKAFGKYGREVVHEKHYRIYKIYRAAQNG